MRRRLNWLWPGITNEDEAKSAARRAAGAALFVAICTGGFAILALVNGRSYAGIDRGGLWDAALFAFIAWRLLKHSFPWAIFSLFLMLTEIFWMLSNREGSVGIITVLILFALVAGARGTFFLRKENKKAAAESVALPMINCSQSIPNKQHPL